MTMISKKVFTSSNYRLFMLPAFTRAFLFKSSPSGELSYNTKNRKHYVYGSKHETGFEPAALALARRCSTTEPLVHTIKFVRIELIYYIKSFIICQQLF